MEANCCSSDKLSKCFNKYFIFPSKKNIFSRKNIDAAFPNLNKQEKRDLFNKNLKSMIHGIFDTGRAWFWNDSKINSLIKYEIFGLNKLIATKGNLLIFKHSHHLELDSRILGLYPNFFT